MKIVLNKQDLLRIVSEKIVNEHKVNVNKIDIICDVTKKLDGVSYLTVSDIETLTFNIEVG